MLKAGIIGATGYGGAELFRLLQRHPQVQVAALASRSNTGSPYWEVYPHFYGHTDLVLQEIDLPNLFDQCDLIFTALPHGHAMPVAQEAVRQGKKLIDLGADFRFDQTAAYEQWYKVEHTAPELNAQAVYGLPELFRSQIPTAQILANPGCYPTASALALAPLAQNNLIDLQSIIIDAKSGVSGAGRSLSLNSHYCEANDSIKAYGIAGHRHTPEIEQTLERLAGQEARITFTPHLTPMTRGILATCYADLTQELTPQELRDLYIDFYQNEPFVQILPVGMLPQTKSVYGSNYCQISPMADTRTGRVIVLSVIDNLVKGAAGQAIQNLNLMSGWPETTALTEWGLQP